MNTLKDGICVVIPNYNGINLLKENIPSLINALKKSGVNYQIIVSDDASSDNSIEFLQHTYPDIVVLKSKKNTGFSANCNRGISASSYTLTCVTNTDVTFNDDYFEKSLPYFSDAGVFAVKGDIYNYIEHTGNVSSIDRTTQTYFKKGLIRFRTDINPDTGHFSANIGSQYVGLGCCFIARTDQLKKLGGFDEIYSPYYWEDSDIALRAMEQGYRLQYAPECIVYHKAGSTIGTTQTSFRRKLISNRNKFLFSWLHMKTYSQWFSHFAFLLLGLLTRWIILDIRYYMSFAMALGKIITRRKPGLLPNHD